MSKAHKGRAFVSSCLINENTNRIYWREEYIIQKNAKYTSHRKIEVCCKIDRGCWPSVTRFTDVAYGNEQAFY